MKPTDTDTEAQQANPGEMPPTSLLKKTLIALLWLTSVGFWAWAGIQLGQLIGDLWL
jgi:hypothetical protein